MSDDNAFGSLSIDMLEEAVKISQGNFGAPNNFMMDEGIYQAWIEMQDPGYRVKYNFHETMSRLLWPSRVHTIYYKNDCPV